MANVTVCDRCGIILKPFSTGLVDIQVTRDVKYYYFNRKHTDYLHMCNNCYDAFGAFLRGEGGEEVTKEYEEARDA